MNACANPDILRVIYFFMIIIDIVKIVIPIALIIYGLIDFSKAVISSDEKAQSKSLHLFFKRLLYGVLVFAVPWIVEVLMIAIGDWFKDGETLNFTDCLENANAETINQIENGTFGWHCYVCKSDDTKKKYQDKQPNPHDLMCNATWKETDLSKEECK